MEEQVGGVLVHHRASAGYSTCFWYTVRNSTLLHDPTGWFARLQERAAAPYPEPLRQAIVAMNHPILRDALSSYTHQIDLALSRRDPVSVNHRLAALLASYFDILFAVNAQPHPGEKLLLAKARSLCPQLPDEMEADVEAVLGHPVLGQDNLLPALRRLLDRLDTFLDAQEIGRPAGR
jgi:hypothetical protein